MPSPLTSWNFMPLRLPSWKLPKSLPVSGWPEVSTMSQSPSRWEGLNPAGLQHFAHRVGARLDGERVVAVGIGHRREVHGVAGAVGADQ